MLNLSPTNCQPCADFRPDGGPHWCPECDGTRYFCKTCHRDHHEGGWQSCLVTARRLNCQHPACLAAKGEVLVSNPLCIYVAGPLTSTPERSRAYNVNEAIRAGLALMRKGHHPFVPHLTTEMESYAYVRDRPVPTYERWMEMDFAWLARADAILYLAPSPGADRELARAQELGLTIYRSVDEVPCVEVVA